MRFLLLLVWVLSGVSGCAPREVAPADSGRPVVLATTTIVGDIVDRVAGDSVHVEVLLPVDADPHDYILRPADLVRVSKADLIFLNGASLEGPMETTLRRAARRIPIVSLDRNIPLRYFDEMSDSDHVHAPDCNHGPVDPHYWADPHLVMIWADTIAEALSEIDAVSSKDYHARAESLKRSLADLDAWIVEQVQRIPLGQRLLVTDHLSLGYFADRYGFDQKGVIIRSFDSMAQPSARDIAALVDVLKKHDVPAIFVGASVNPRLAEQIGRDTGTQLAMLHSGALTGPQGSAPDYFAYMRSNVETMVHHLSENP